MNIQDVQAAGGAVYLCPYSRASASAKGVAEYLLSQGIKVRVRVRDPFTAGEGSVVLNWGQPACDFRASGAVVPNAQSDIAVAVNKSTALATMSMCGVRVPDSTPSQDVAARWLQDGSTVVARHVLSSHSGKGIQIVNASGNVYRCSTLPEDRPWYAARLFTKYIKKAQEYRVFVVGQSCIFAYRKGLSTAVDENSRQFMVRTHATGWNFCDVALSDVPGDVQLQAVLAMRAIGLQYGAVDVGWNEHQQAAYVFEVNTAPGLQGTSIEKFCSALLKMELRQAPTLGIDPVPVQLAPTATEVVVRTRATSTTSTSLRWDGRTFQHWINNT